MKVLITIFLGLVLFSNARAKNISDDVPIIVNNTRIGYLLGPSGSFSFAESSWYGSDIQRGDFSLHCNLKKGDKEINDNRIDLTSSYMRISKEKMSPPFEYVEQFYVMMKFEKNSYEIESLSCACVSEISEKCQEEVNLLNIKENRHYDND